MRSLPFIFLFFCPVVLGQLDDARKKQLDSIVTNVNRTTLVDLDSVQLYLHQIGQNDAERVFLYYGLIGIHYRYDYERKAQRAPKEYTPYYTAKSRKGVCRDFSALFKELCDRSAIPCVIADGRTNVPFREGVSDFFKGKLKTTNHAWNVVKYDDEWHLMDPTWSQVNATEKYYEQDENGRRKYKSKAKRPTRNFYDAPSAQFYLARDASHPAFYVNDTIYTYKSARKNRKRREVLYTNYDYASVLDSLATNDRFKISKAFTSEGLAYSKNSQLNYYLNYAFKYIELKRTKSDPITLESCDAHMSDIENLLAYLKTEYNKDYSPYYAADKEKVLKYKKRLERNNTRSVSKR